MKKVIAKTKNKTVKKESEFEMLARIVSGGFERMEKKFEEVDKRFDGIDLKFEMIDSQFFAINYTLREHTERLDRIEKKQFGMSENTKEMVTKNDFKDLVSRVDIIEKKVAKK